MCAQWRFWSRCAFAQPDQNLHLAHFRYPRIQSFFTRTKKTLIRPRTSRLSLVLVGRTCPKVCFLTPRLICSQLCSSPEGMYKIFVTPHFLRSSRNGVGWVEQNFFGQKLFEGFFIIVYVRIGFFRAHYVFVFVSFLSFFFFPLVLWCISDITLKISLLQSFERICDTYSLQVPSGLVGQN